MTKHTPGPLQLGRRGLSPAVRDADGRLIAELPYHASSRADYVLIDEAIANAELFAAAPELLEALREVLELCAVGDVDESTEALGWGKAIQAANAAIARATGAHP